MTRLKKSAAITTAVLVPIAFLLNAAGGADKDAGAAGNGRLMSSRAGSCAAVLKDGRILITGGEASKATIVGTAERFTVVTGTSDAAPMPTPRVEHACATLGDGRVLVVGGLRLVDRL